MGSMQVVRKRSALQSLAAAGFHLRMKHNNKEAIILHGGIWQVAQQENAAIC